MNDSTRRRSERQIALLETLWSRASEEVDLRPLLTPDVLADASLAADLVAFDAGQRWQHGFAADSDHYAALAPALVEIAEVRTQIMMTEIVFRAGDGSASVQEEFLARCGDLAPDAELLLEFHKLLSDGEDDLVAPTWGDGRYQAIRELGRGGFAVVYEAEDTRTGATVAVKVLENLALEADTVMRRFERESRIATRLQDPGICGVFDSGMQEASPFIAMELIEGRPLARMLRIARRDSPEPRCLELPGVESDEESIRGVALMGAHIAASLQAAHAKGVIHRDIKPGNLMIKTDGRPVIVDFGLASLQAGASAITRTGDVIGSPAYMSPEQVMGEPVDVRTDIWSLGVTLFECLTLQRPFHHANRSRLYESILSDPVPSLRTLNPRVDGAVAGILERALQKDRADRHASARELAADLQRWAG